MSSVGPTLKAFNGLNGRELAKILVVELERALNADTRFSQHLTYPLVSWQWKISIKAYPNEPPEFQVEIGPKSIGYPEAANSLAEVEINLGASREVTAPVGETADSARRDAGIPVPSPRTVKGPGGNRMVVDAPDIKPTEVPRPTVTADETKNVGKGGKVFARSVTAKTAAAPEGIEAGGPAGSAPDEERVRQILEKEETGE